MRNPFLFREKGCERLGGRFRLTPAAMGRLTDYVGFCLNATTLHDRRRFGEAVIEAIRPSLYVFFSQRCPPDSVLDVLQETLVTIATHLHNFRGQEDAQFWGWCYGIASNKLKQHWDRDKSHLTDSLDLEEVRRVVEAMAEDRTLPPGMRLDVEHALKLLEFGQPPCRDLIWSFYVLDRDYQDLADAYGLSYDAVRMKIKRCLERAQELMGEKGER